MASAQQTRRLNLIACIAAATTVTVTLGLSWPLLAIVLERQGVPHWLNGMSASAQMIAVLVVMPLAPALIGKLGLVRMIAFGMIGMAGCLALLPVFPNVWAWFPIRFALGLCTEIVFIAADIWINRLADDRSRGRLIGVYGLFLHGGFALGPLAIIALGSEDWTALHVAIVAVLAGLGPLALAGGSESARESRPRARLLHYLRVATPLMLAGLMFGLIESSTEALLPVYGLEKGLDEDSAALLITMFVTGALLGQIPFGWLADRFEAHRLLSAGAAVTLLALVAMPAAVRDPLLIWPVMIAMGASLGSFYVVAMTMMGRLYRDDDLIGVNTSFVFIWGLGAAAGPGLSGASMDTFGPDGMPALGAFLCVVFLLILHRWGRRAGPGSGLGPDRI